MKNKKANTKLEVKMSAAQNIALFTFSDINKLYDQIFKLELDKIQLQSEVDHLRMSIELRDAFGKYPCHSHQEKVFCKISGEE